MKSKIIFLVLMLIFLVQISIAAGSVSILNPTDGDFVSSLDVIFYYNVDSNETIDSCSILVDNNIEKTDNNIQKNSQESFELSFLSDGPYDWKIVCSESGGLDLESVTNVINIDTKSPVVTLLAPKDNYETNISLVTFNYLPVDSNLERCEFWSDIYGSFQNNQIDVNPNSGSLNSFSFNIEDGIYDWTIFCFDESDLTSMQNPTFNLIVDTSEPTVIEYSPLSRVYESSTTLNVVTDEDCVCRYSKDSNESFSLMEEFSETGGTDHLEEISNLEGKTYSYYIKCKDNIGNLMTNEFEISFEVSLPPYAEIVLSDTSPVKSGILEIEVITSKNMKEPPLLYYSLDESLTKMQIPLTGIDKKWNGLIVIEDDDEDYIGAFHFEGTDTLGNTGTFIRKGRLFVIDTIEPGKPTNIESFVLETGDVAIDWYYEDSDVDFYRVYRGTKSGLTYLDYYSSTNSTNYLDSSTVDKATYYYKVAVVDKAGNIGPLSDETYVTSLSGENNVEKTVEEDKTIEDVPKVLPPDLVPIVDSQIKRVESLLIDVREIKTKFDGFTEIKKELIQTLEYDKTFTNLDSKLREYIEKLNNLKLIYRTQFDLEDEILKIEMELKKIEQTTPKEVTILEKAELIQSTSNQDIRDATDELFANFDMGDIDQGDYFSDNKKTQNDVMVEIKIRVIEIQYMDETKDEKSLVQKKVIYESSDSIEDVIIIETIPKEVAENTEGIEFLTKNYEVLKEDPVIKWSFFKLDYEGQEINYIIDKKINLENAKKAKTVLLMNLDMVNANKVTGYSVISPFNISNTQKTFIWIGLIVIAGLSIYYMFFIKGSQIPMNLFSYGVDSKNPYPKKISFKSKSAIKKIQPISSYEENMEYVNGLINDAFGYLNNNQKNRAALLYPKIQMLYGKLPSNLKSKLHNNCIELHKRIHKK